MSAPLEDYARWVLNPGLPKRPFAPRSSYFVCGTPRSGSWLLCGLLHSTGIAGRPHEWFWRDTEVANQRAWAVAGFAEYLARVFDAGTTSNGVFGSKLMWAYMGEFIGKLRLLRGVRSDASLISQSFPSPRFVWIRRQDVVAQAVSWARAIQTGRWHHWDSPEQERAAMYHRDQIDALVQVIRADDAAWRGWFADNGIRPFEIHFDELAADRAGATRKVLAFLGLETDRVSITEQTIPRDPDTTDDWLTRYRLELLSSA